MVLVSRYKLNSCDAEAGSVQDRSLSPLSPRGSSHEIRSVVVRKRNMAKSQEGGHLPTVGDDACVTNCARGSSNSPAWGCVEERAGAGGKDQGLLISGLAGGPSLKMSRGS